MDKTIGVLGGGQLGRMLTEAANRLNIKVVILDKEESPAKQINAYGKHIDGSFKDPSSIRQLAERCDVLTVEIEHVNTDVLEEISADSKAIVQPNWRTIRVIQDKYHQKEHLLEHGIATARSMVVEDSEGMKEVAQELGYPFMLKSRTNAYDGRGNYPVKSESDAKNAVAVLQDRPLYAEQWVRFKAELAVMVVKVEESQMDDWHKATLAFPVVETVHEDSVCKLVYAPARHVSNYVLQEAQDLARRAVSSFWGKGVFGVEMFLLEDGNLMINEIAPRPHNSGHYTIEACPLSQYDTHIRAILGLAIPPQSLHFATPDTYAIMLNILGGSEVDTHLTMAQAALKIPAARIHLYGKGDAHPGRKMGHVTVLASSMKKAEQRIEPLVIVADRIRKERLRSQPLSPTAPSPPKKVGSKQSEEPQSSEPPIVAITMGSDSDRTVLAPGVELLKDLGISYSVTITSAHRTPDRMCAFAREAASKGVKVIIAAAGGAAHLPGMIAALTPLPVIGIPVKASVLDGLDSLLSIVQMPRGVPVATVAINNSINAAQLAVRILGTTDLEIRKRLEDHLADQTSSVLAKGERMERVGFRAYDTER